MSTLRIKNRHFSPPKFHKSQKNQIKPQKVLPNFPHLPHPISDELYVSIWAYKRQFRVSVEKNFIIFSNWPAISSLWSHIDPFRIIIISSELHQSGPFSTNIDTSSLKLGQVLKLKVFFVHSRKNFNFVAFCPWDNLLWLQVFL